MTLRKITTIGAGVLLAGGIIGGLLLFYVASNLPKMFTMEDYKPKVVSEVFAIGGEKIGEFYREKRIVVPYEKIPKKLVYAFLSAEDSSFFEHGGINYISILRAAITNIKAGRAAQGASTITQQVARSLLLTREKTITRKIREIMLSYQIEANFTKEQILYLYLNQIYLGGSAYGVAAAAENYYRKTLDKLTVAEMAILAGMPQAPSRYSPVEHPFQAKERQRYVLRRMAEEGHITQEEAEAALQENVTIYLRENFNMKAPYFVETVRQSLTKSLGDDAVIDEGLHIETTLDLKKQLAAQDAVREGLREIDKRQGYRGPLKNISDVEGVARFLVETRNELMKLNLPTRVLTPEGRAIPEQLPLNLNHAETDPNLAAFTPVGGLVQGIVTKVDDKLGLVFVRFAEQQGLIDLETMEWARKPDPNVKAETAEIKLPSEALKSGDVILIKVAAEKFTPGKRLTELLDDLGKVPEPLKKNPKAKPTPTPTPPPELAELPDFKRYAALYLEQEPLVEGSLLSMDTNTGAILAMVGGYDYERSEFNRALQAARQTGSSFKPVVYASALDHGFNPASTIIDAPIVYQDEGQYEENANLKESQKEKSWKPTNYTEQFLGDILFRNALIKSLNIPTVKIEEKVGLNLVSTYARRLGVFSPLNMDLTLGLGSSSVTLYELTRVYAHFARLGKRITTPFITKVLSKDGATLRENITLESRFADELKRVDDEFEEKRKVLFETPTVDPSGSPVAGASTTPADALGNPAQEAVATLPKAEPKNSQIFFEDPDQLISPQTSYLMTNLLQGVVTEGTAVRARSLGRPIAGKTGTTNGYYDAWFVGYSPQIVSGVWVGLDSEKTLGRGETGGRSALPIWIYYMKAALEGLPVQNFAVPKGIVFANINNETGTLASASSKSVVRQAFLEGTEPKTTQEDPSSVDHKSFLKEDLTE